MKMLKFVRNLKGLVYQKEISDSEINLKSLKLGDA